jgi:hypothetical protein
MIDNNFFNLVTKLFLIPTETRSLRQVIEAKKTENKKNYDEQQVFFIFAEHLLIIIYNYCNEKK